MRRPKTTPWMPIIAMKMRNSVIFAMNTRPKWNPVMSSRTPGGTKMSV